MRPPTQGRGDLMTATAHPAKAIPPRTDAYQHLLDRCRELPPITTAVAYPCEVTALTAPTEAAEPGQTEPTLVAPAATIRDIAKKANLNIDPYPIEDIPDPKAAAARAVELVRQARAEVLMKG